MKELSHFIQKVLAVAVLSIAIISSCFSVKEAEAASLKSVTVTTQKQLSSALNNTKISKITIKPKIATKFLISKGTYEKDLIVYQTYTTLINEGDFEDLNVIIKNKSELSSALNTKDTDSITLKTTSKIDILLEGDHSNIDLIVDSSRSNITNNGQWEDIIIKNNATWVENAENNNFNVTAAKFNLTTKEEAGINSILVNRSSAVINITANSTIETITLKGNATINLSGKLEGQVLNSIRKENTKSKVKVTTNTATYSIESYNTVVEVKSSVSKIHIHDNGTWYEQMATTTRIGAKVRACNQCRVVLEIITTPKLAEDNQPIEPAQEHTHTYNTKVTKVATCTTDGILTYTCVEGDGNYTVVIRATGHDQGTWYEQKATTTYKGVKVKACTKCGAILASESIPMIEITHSHSYTSTVTLQPTITSTGIRTYTCTVGDHVYTEVIPKLAHTHTYTSVITLKPTTTSAGIKTYTCTSGDDSYTEVVPMLEDAYAYNGHELTTVTIDLGKGQTKDVKGYYDYDMAQEVFVKLNELRTAKGLNNLKWNNGMTPSADIRAAELTVKFDHWRPNGEYCYDIYSTMSSENVAFGYTSAADVMVGWINSTAHYNAMVKSDYKSVSISCFMYELFPGQWVGYWSMLFSKY